MHLVANHQAASPDSESGTDNILHTRASIPVAATIDEAAILLTLSRRTVADLIATGRLKSKRIGRRRIITRAALEEFLK